MREAQAEIKATVSVNTGDGLNAKQDDKDQGKDENPKKKGGNNCFNLVPEYIVTKYWMHSHVRWN